MAENSIKKIIRTGCSKVKLAYFCALDWARENHYFHLQDCNGKCLDEGYFENSPEGFKEFMDRLRKVRSRGNVGLIYESHQGLPLSVLLPQNWLILYPVNPIKTRKLNQLQGSGRGKNDARDSHLLADYLRQNYAGLDPYVERDPMMLALKIEVALEERLVSQRTAQINQIKDLFSQFCPKLNSLIPDLKASVYQQYLLELDLNNLMAPQPLAQWLRDHHLYAPSSIKEFVHTHQQLRPLTGSSELQSTLQAQLGTHLRILQQIQKELSQCEKRIESLFNSMPQAAIYRSLPHVGPRLAPRLASLFGSNPKEAYKVAAQATAYFGQSPVTESSGGKDPSAYQPGELPRRKTRKRQCCNRFARQVIFLWAKSCAMNGKNSWQQAYLDRRKKHGDLTGTRYRKLGKKLVTVAHYCLVNNCHYDDDVYCKNLRNN